MTEGSDSSPQRIGSIGCRQEVMLVGDPYQAIYEWRQAEPRLFEDKFNDWQENSFRLSENWRSTQSICDVASKLANAAEITTARNPEVAHYDHAPLLIPCFACSSTAACAVCLHSPIWFVHSGKIHPYLSLCEPGVRPGKFTF